MPRFFVMMLVVCQFVGAGCKGDEVKADPNEDVNLRVGFIQDCGDETCDLEAGEVCCMDGVARGECGSEAECGDGFMTCDGPEDCAEGSLCCGELSGNVCGTDCDLVVCHDSDDCEGLEDTPVCRESAFVEMNYCKEE